MTDIQKIYTMESRKKITYSHIIMEIWAEEIFLYLLFASISVLTRIYGSHKKIVAETIKGALRPSKVLELV